MKVRPLAVIICLAVGIRRTTRGKVEFNVELQILRSLRLQQLPDDMDASFRTQFAIPNRGGGMRSRSSRKTLNDAFCKPTFTSDEFGVHRASYARKGCEFGRNE
jgi:hypothetical protein